MTEILRLTQAEIRALDAEMEAKAAAGSVHLRAGSLSPGSQSAAGLGGYLFIALGSNRWETRYQGEVDISPGWFAAWAALLEQRQEKARQLGVELWNVVVPEKQVILPELRWRQPPSGAKRPFLQLLARLKPEHRVHYCAADLARAKAEGPVFHVLDSHWCASGVLAATAGLLAGMQVDVDVAKLRFAYAREVRVHDLTKHFFVEPPSFEAGRLQANGDMPHRYEALLETGRYTGTQLKICNPDAPDPRRLAIFGDSYSYEAGLLYSLSAVFAEVWFLWSKEVAWPFVEREGVDVVIWESAERFMPDLPKA